MALARYAIHDASASQAMRGCGLLMPLLDKANASDNAVAEFADVIPVPRSMYPRLDLLGVSIFSQLLRTCRRSYDPRSSGFPILHVCPRVLGSLCGGENNDTENQGNANRPEVETTYLRSKQTGEVYAYSV